MTERDEAWFREAFTDHHRAVLSYAVLFCV